MVFRKSLNLLSFSRRKTEGDGYLRNDVQGVKDIRAEGDHSPEKGSARNQKIIPETGQPKQRVGKEKRKKRKRKYPRFSEMKQGKQHVAEQICIIEERKHRYCVNTGAENEKGCGNEYGGKRGAQDQMHPFSLGIPVLGVDPQEVSDLRDAEKAHSGDALLIGQKHEEEIRADGAQQSDLREQGGLRAIREHCAKEAGGQDTNIGKEGEPDVIHAPDEDELYRQENRNQYE